MKTEIYPVIEFKQTGLNTCLTTLGGLRPILYNISSLMYNSEIMAVYSFTQGKSSFSVRWVMFIQPAV